MNEEIINRYKVMRDIFYLKKGEGVNVIARTKTPNGDSLIVTTDRGIENIQFWVPSSLLENITVFWSPLEATGSKSSDKVRANAKPVVSKPTRDTKGNV